MSDANPEQPSDDSVDKIKQLLAAAFGTQRPDPHTISNINRGRGVFSNVYQLALIWPPKAGGAPKGDDHDARPPVRTRFSEISRAVSNQQKPDSLVAKLPCHGPNRAAASLSGAYHRELVAYSTLLSKSQVLRPKFYAGLDFGDQTTGLLMEDLTRHRSVDQLTGLQPPDIFAVADTLARFHQEWATPNAATASVRRSVVETLPEAALVTGLRMIETEWSNHVDSSIRSVFKSLLKARHRLIEMFLDSSQPLTLCHGDPRADNLVFNDNGQAILFDWQQIAIQIGEADLAWLAGTSAEIETRRAIDTELVSTYGGNFQRYRLGFTLPGLAVLMLAQRELTSVREVHFVAESLRRIGQALLDLEVCDLSR